MGTSHFRYPRVLCRCKSLDARLTPAGRCRRLVLVALLLSISLVVVVPAQATADDYAAIAVTWNTVTAQNELRSIDLATGMSTYLNSFVSGSGSWIGGTLATDASENRCYLLSSGHEVYSFDLTNGQVVSTVGVVGIQNMKMGPSGMLYGIQYNSGTSQNDLYRIDPATGTSTLLGSFALDAGYSDLTFAIHPDVNRGYILTSAKTLYALDLSSGDVISTLPVAFPADALSPTLVLSSDGTLYSFAITQGLAGQWRLLAIDPLTGATEVVTPFGFPSALSVLEFLLPPSHANFYPVTVSGGTCTLHTFDMTSGALLSSVPIGDLPVTTLLLEVEGYTTREPAIPTLTEWGAIVFGGLLLASVLFILARREKLRRRTV